jgi:TRAP-type C4-dicarboxylate transport system permease small subunit
VHHSSDTNTEAVAANHVNRLLFISHLLAAVGTIWIFCMMLLIVADVLGRNFFDTPITGVAEFAARSVASIVFLQLASSIASGRMTRSDFLLKFIGRFSPSTVKFLEVLNVCIGAFLFLALALISWPHLIEALEIKEFFGVQGVFTVVTWPFRALILLGSVMGAAAYVACIVQVINGSTLRGDQDE